MTETYTIAVMSSNRISGTAFNYTVLLPNVLPHDATWLCETYVSPMVLSDLHENTVEVGLRSEGLSRFGSTSNDDWCTAAMFTSSTMYVHSNPYEISFDRTPSSMQIKFIETTDNSLIATVPEHVIVFVFRKVEKEHKGK